MRGEEAEAALRFLKDRMYEGFTNPDQAVISGLWEDNSDAVKRRKKERAEFEARLEGVDRPTQEARRQSDDDDDDDVEEEEPSSDEDDNNDNADYESHPRKRKQPARGRGRS